MSAPDRFEKLVATAAAAVLVAGLLRGSVGVASQYLQMLRTPIVLGPAATTDALVRSMGLPAADALASGIARAGWPLEHDVAVVAPVSAVSVQEAVQFLYVAGYVLYPRRVWLIRWCDPRVSAATCSAESGSSAGTPVIDLEAALLARQTRHLIVLGPEPLPLRPARAHALSPVVHLLQI